MEDHELEKMAEKKYPYEKSGFSKQAFIAGWKANDANIEQYKTALEDLIEAIPGQTDDKDWWPDDLRTAVKNAEKLLQ